jgi:TniQ
MTRPRAQRSNRPAAAAPVHLLAAPKPLPFRRRPQQGESFMGYVARLAEINGYDGALALLRLMGLNSPADALRSGGLARMSAMTETSAEELDRLRHPPIGKGRRGRHRFLAQTVRYVQIRKGPPRACSGCLAENGWMAAVWGLQMVDACPIHGCLLLSKCPGCGQPFRWRNFKATRCANCELPMGEMHREPAEGGVEALLALHHGFGLTTDAQARARLQLPDWFWRLPGGAMLDLLLVLEMLELDLPRPRVVPPKEVPAHVSLATGYRALVNWPEGFFGTLERMQSASRRFDGVPLMARDFGKYVATLRNRPKESPWTELHAAFETFLRDRAPLTRRIKFVSRAAAEESRLIVGAEACRRLEVTLTKLKFLVSLGLLTPKRMGGARGTFIILDAAEVDALRGKVPKFVTLPQAARLLGVSEKRTRALVAGGILPRNGTAHETNISLEDIDRLTSELSQRVRPGTGADLIPLSNVAKRLALAGADFADFVRLVRGGALTPRPPAARRSGISGLRFSEEQVEAVIRKSFDGRRNLLSPPHAARLLEKRIVFVHFLVEARLVTAVSTGPHGGTRLITRESLLRFRERHVTGQELAAEVGSSAALVGRALAASGIRPVKDPSRHRNGQAVYRRWDLEGLDVAAAVDRHALARPSWRGSRPERVSAYRRLYRRHGRLLRPSRRRDPGR